MRRFALTPLVLASALVVAGPPASVAADAHMQNHVDLLFRLGFKGKISADYGSVTGSVPADTSFGGDFRYDIPIARYVTLGPVISVYAVRPESSGIDRNPIVDIDPFVKVRYVAGRKNKIELYALFQGGFSMAFLRKSTGATDRFGPGWNIGIAPGLQLLLGRRFGLITEIGWMRTQGNFDAANLIVNQGIWRVGFAF